MSTPTLCRLCGQELTRTFVDLGMSPPCESYLRADQLDSPETFHPLNVRICDDCLLVQLPAYIAPGEVFSDYADFSSYSDSWVDHARRFVEDTAARLRLGPVLHQLSYARDWGAQFVLPIPRLEIIQSLRSGAT